MQKQIRLALKSVRAILKPNIEAVADPEERGDYQGLLQDYVGTVKSYLKSVKSMHRCSALVALILGLARLFD